MGELEQRQVVATEQKEEWQSNFPLEKVGELPDETDLGSSLVVEFNGGLLAFRNAVRAEDGDVIGAHGAVEYVELSGGQISRTIYEVDGEFDASETEPLQDVSPQEVTEPALD